MMENYEPASERLILYQLFLRSFSNEKEPQVPGANWSVNGSGTLDKLSLEVLQSIRDLGCNAVWITGLLRHASASDNPAYTSPKAHPSLVKGLAGSPYAIEDFFATDPDLHSRPDEPWKELGECLQRIHSLGMKSIVDFVPNHCARFYRSDYARSSGLRDLGEGDDKTQAFHPENHFYYLPGSEFHLPFSPTDSGEKPWMENPARATGNDCFRPDPSVNDWYETVKLNYGIDYRTGEKHFDPPPPLWLYMREVLRFWASKGFQGFRCDMAEMVPPEFWLWVIGQLKSEFPGCLFIAEIYQTHRYREYLEAGFDFLYDKEGMYNALREVLEGRSGCSRFTQVWQEQEGIGHRFLRFLENHDEQRIASRFAAGNAFHALPAFALAAFSSRSALMVYAGQELGEKAEGAEGFSGDDGRSSIFDYAAVPSLQTWLQEVRQKALFLQTEQRNIREEYRKILRLADECPALYRGHFFDLQYVNPPSPKYDAHRVYSFLRHLDEERFLVIANFSGEEQNLNLIIPKAAWDFMALPSIGKAQLIPVAEEVESIGFELETSLENEGAGIPIQILAHAYRIFRIVLLS